ncbi:MAG: ABC transporter permease [Proteobacteria bacterium]|nr:ABC transporter permease [Pseudomonadota bacterium]
MKRLVELLGKKILNLFSEAGLIFLLFLETIRQSFKRPLKLERIFDQMEFIGVRSLFVVVLVSTFTGMVLALQTYTGFRRFSAESMVGAVVALSLCRELGPVLTSIMVTARAGSAMAAEIGTMRVTEQIDALVVMAVNPIKYLVVPRVIASILVVPILTVISDFTGIVGGYLVGVKVLNINSGVYINRTLDLLEISDIYNGLLKSVIFGLLLSIIGCYKGYYTKGGARGVGKATTEAVVLACVVIFVADYVLTAFLF